ncbi:hypothetical protein ABGN05_00110 [Aquibium sp. LZ166]|uniref:DUF3037 domain-containing protein n=1 Tax=Aquibium pacificus TaxID=3153579 RepID=A0ABV3SEK4_9HYPH
MAHSHRFSIIQARPDAMRSERVNVGVVVIGPDGLDVRLTEVRKLLHLTGHRWDEIAQAYRDALSTIEIADLEAQFARHGSARGTMQSEVFVLGKPGEIRARSPEEYETAVRRILSTFVDKPQLSRREKQQKINTEISQMLRQVGVLGERGQRLDEGKVVPKFVISEEKEIVADFAYRPNGLKVVSTLELRGVSTGAHAKACEKGATLYFAKQKFGAEVKPFGVYAVTPDQRDIHKGEIEILTSFADGNAFNWMDPKDRQKFKAALY